MKRNEGDPNRRKTKKNKLFLQRERIIMHETEESSNGFSKFSDNYTISISLTEKPKHCILEKTTTTTTTTNKKQNKTGENKPTSIKTTTQNKRCFLEICLKLLRENRKTKALDEKQWAEITTSRGLFMESPAMLGCSHRKEPFQFFYVKKNFFKCK